MENKNAHLDVEWVCLMSEAKRIGLEKYEIKSFLKSGGNRMGALELVNEYEEYVMEWIGNHFDLSTIQVKDFTALPYGKQVIDHKGSEIFAFFNYFKGVVEVFLPCE